MPSNQSPYKFTKSGLSLIFTSFLIVITPLIVIPGISHLIWKVKPSSKMDILVIDKTVPDKSRLEHRSFFWALKHLRIKRQDGAFYQYDKDYLGFYPKKDGNHKVKSLRYYSDEKIDSISKALDVLYLADTYGVYESDFNDQSELEFSRKIYGGLSSNDLKLTQKVIDAEGLLIAEFNSIGAPTSFAFRTQFEKMMNFKWTGWISRYFDELNPELNEEIPEWLINNYKEQHNGIWEFEGAAQVFVSEEGRIEVLKYGEDISNQVPKVISTLQSQQKFDIPKETNYPYWFEILRIDRSYEVISYIDMAPTKSGEEKLREMGLPRYFPATIVRNNGKGKIYYFTGDYADNPIPLSSAPFFGVPTIYKLVNDKNDYSNRTSFYWNYYFPLIKEILEEHSLN
ncbi:hypothetical protein IFO69_10960 [Echinicola sp. CAU 1574]|uniref:Uncharacterized protein n=1 Tax=Echinicola arenosa TaxID=2774144 RepID=A0ABR9AKN3_9BACT|nr:hypothetical protein [Echinicola arenosa]MBD8489265.1 hypothetical protein [Echinicola arenosa]